MSLRNKGSSEEWCDHCDLPQWCCEHGGDIGAADVLPFRLSPRQEPSDWTITFDASVYSREWKGLDHAHRPRTIMCDHPNDDHLYLCAECQEDFRTILADIPAMTLELEIAATRQTQFVDHGTHGKADESPLPFDDAARQALARLGRALGVERASLDKIATMARMIEREIPLLIRVPDIVDRAAQITAAVAHAYRVIDRPPDMWYFGPCPKCKEDIFDDRSITHVTCECGYAAALADHQSAALNAGEDRMLTVSELVGAITWGGETITRDQINGWIRRDGLPREIEHRPAWQAGRLVSRSAYVYRLGDVLDRLRQQDRRQA